MNMKNALTALFFCLLAVSAVGFSAARADSGNPIYFSGGVTVFSPLNETYTYNYLTLTMSTNLDQNVAMPIELSYSIDGNSEEPIFLTDMGNIHLPMLTNGSHRLTVFERAYLTGYLSWENPPGAPFKETPIGSGNYTATWADTIYFSINNETSPIPSPTPASDTSTPTVTPVTSIPEFSWLVIVPLVLSVFSVVMIVKHQKNS